jgi:hypothetical protein
MKSRQWIVFGVLLAVTVSCRSVAKEARAYELDSFSFTIPAGWQTHEEVWGSPMAEDADFYRLGVSTAATIQYPPEKGKGNAFFSVATSPLGEGEDLESRFNLAYQNPVPEIEEVSQQEFDLGELTGFEITYKRPWGEPWWRFQDVWLEKDGVVYVLSFHTAPTRWETYTETLTQILDSFSFKD